MQASSTNSQVDQYKEYLTRVMKFGLKLFITLAYLQFAVWGLQESQELINFEANYILKDYSSIGPHEVAYFDQGEEVTLVHTIVNKEDSDISIVGVGGSLLNPSTNEISVNLTANTVGPIVIKSGDLASVGQKIALKVAPGNYALSPQVYVAFLDELKAIQPRKQLAIVRDVPISLTSPQFLFLECILVIVLVIIAKMFYPESSRNNHSGSKETTKKASASGVDPSWLPPNHQQLSQSKRHKRRDY